MSETTQPIKTDRIHGTDAQDILWHLAKPIAAKQAQEAATRSAVVEKTPRPRVTWRDRFTCWMYGHVPKSEVGYHDAVLHEPTHDPDIVAVKQARIRVMTCRCDRCGVTLDVQPLGVVS